MPARPAVAAQAEPDAGVVDPRLAEDIAAELAQAQQDRETLAWFRERWRQVGHLCAGRPLEHMLQVGEVLTAIDGKTPTTAPLTVEWDGTVSFPDGAMREARAVVECTTARGGRADLILTGPKRQALVSLLDAELRNVHAPCPTRGCGTADEYDASDPALSGWARVEVAGVEDSGARWYCSPMCVSDALARAGEELAEADAQAELDGGL
ncbi:hypothetical protein ACWD11_22615 [Streptomyces sp. NPDC002776]